MNKDDVIRLAREAQVHEELTGEFFIHEFAKLVAEHEREACAKICDEWASGLSGEPEMVEMAAEIRARGQA